MPDSASMPDVRQLRDEALASGEFPGGRELEFRAFLAPGVHELVWKHANGTIEVEICGVLVGEWRRDKSGPYLDVSACLACDAAKSKFAEVTFTHEAWAKINAEMDTKYSNLRIVGWYHSHPDFGVFLSDRDVFIHQHFFSAPGQVALVVDPVRKTEGLFTWQNGRPQLAPHYWVGNRVFTPQAAVDAETRPAVARATAHVEPLERGEEGILASWRQWLPLASLAALLFLCGYLWGGLRSDWERRMIAEGAVAHYGLWKIERPGLEEVLGIINKELGTVDADVEQLAGDHAKLAGDNAAEARKSWNAVRERLRESRRLLGQAGSVYGLSPDERAIVEAMIRRKLADVAGISIVEKEAAGRDEKRADDAGKKDDVPPKDVQTPQKKTGDKKPAAADDSAEKAGKSRSGKEESKASSSKK